MDKHIKIEDVLNALNKQIKPKDALEKQTNDEYASILAFCPDCYYWSTIYIRKDFLRYPDGSSFAPEGLVRVLVKNHAIIGIFDCPNCDNLIIRLYDISTLDQAKAAVRHINKYIDYNELDEYIRSIKFNYIDTEKHDEYMCKEDN